MPDLINVIVVDDSAFMRKIITDILKSAGDINVVSTAKDGNEALEKVKFYKPDVITLDVEMPIMNGITCLKELQKFTDIPVIMLSSLTHSGADATIEALESGAIDFITKPTGLFDINGEEKKQEIIDKIRMAKSIRKGKVNTKTKVRHASSIAVPKSTALKTIVAIGTSTGGPKALQEVIPFIPGNVPAAILVVQHMPPGFTRSLADRLNAISSLTVKEAEDNDKIIPGQVYIAPGDYHMLAVKATDGTMRITLNKSPAVGGHRPAVNVMMNSLAETRYSSVVGVIMTGMGSDGSEGIVNIKKYNKGVIISQDEKSCVVYGMPRAAAHTGMVDIVVPLKNIADEIVKNLGV
jgi:Chemotaxis response regulator containing a CheY-like receiver domain and a methylesterase domain